MSPTLDRHVVTAVLVAHEGAGWLPETLKALLTQTRPVQRIVAADTGSRDRGPAVLAEVVGEGNLLRLPRTTGYGEAVAEALRHPAAEIPVPDDSPGEPRTEWIWLLHDDSAPAHDALGFLLRAADGDPHAGVLGPKVRDWDDRRLLLELGVTIDGAGRRETGVERGEFDQGQHDGVREVLAVGTAGMLVRKDVWDQLGGLDVGFGLFRDDIDFGWRAHAAGHRVIAVSDAVVHHAEASARGRREIGLTAEHAGRRDRRNALTVLLANLPGRAMLRALARNAFGTLLRALSLLLAKRPAAARDEIGALGDVLRNPGALRRARAARASGRKHVYRTVRRFQPRRVLLRRLVDRAAAALFSEGARRRPLDASAPGDHGEGDSSLAPGDPGQLRRLLARPGVLVVLGLTAVALLAERSLLTAGAHLGGGALVPAWGGASDLWAQYISGWHPAGLGSDAGSPPYIGILAALSTLLFGKPWLAVALLLLGGVPLAGLTAYLASGVLLRRRPAAGRRGRAARRRIPVPAVRAWIAATYALLPVATGAVAGGRLGTAVVLVLLPLIALLVARMYGLPRHAGPADPAQAAQAARRAAWGLALLLAVAMAFVPLIWLLAVLGGLLVSAAFGGVRTSAPKAGRRSRRKRGRWAAWAAWAARLSRADRNLAIALCVPPLLLLPWTLGMLRHPSRFLLEAGLNRPGGARPAAADLLSLGPGGPGTPPSWAVYGLLLVAILALPLRSRRTAVLAGWMLALFSLLVAILVSAVTVAKGADRAAAWPGVALILAAGGILLAATAAVQRSVETIAGRHLVHRAGGAAVVLAALTAPVLCGGVWIASGAGGPVGRVGPDVVPSFVAGPGGPRTLMLSRATDGGVSYSVLRGAEPMLGEPETPAGGTAARRMDDLVAGLAAGRDGGDDQALARMGVQYVVVPRPDRDPLTPVLDAAPELTRLSRTSGFGVWRLLSPSGRLMVVEGRTITPLPAGRIDAKVRVPPGGGPRTLLLAEPADGGWRATLNGDDPRDGKVDGWAQAYEIPAAGGEFELTRGMWLRHGWVVIQGLAVLAVLALALPAARVAGDGVRIAGPGSRERRRPRGRRAMPRRRRTGVHHEAPALGPATGPEPDPPGPQPDPPGPEPGPPGPEPDPAGEDRVVSGERSDP